MSPTGKHTIRRVALHALVCWLILQLAACAQLHIPEIKAEYYPQCVQPFQELAQAQKALIQRTALSATLGAAGGALIGGLATGNWKGALIGGIAGGVIAGAAGYATGKQQQIADARERLRSYQADMRTDISNMSRVELYATMCLQCYIKEFRGLLRQFKKHQISREEFAKRHSEIQTGMRRISGILDEAYSQAVQRDQEFRQALISERSLAKRKAKKNRSLETAAQKNAKQDRAIERANTLNKMATFVDKQQKASAKNAARQETALARTLESNTNTSLDALSNDFDSDYTTATVKISSTKAMYAKTIDIMNDSAEKAGIDMVLTDPWMEIIESSKRFCILQNTLRAF